MPELAAHLERVAKAEELAHWILGRVSRLGILTIESPQCVAEIAAALAACALEEAKWWADGMHAAGGGEICKFCERIELLERAVEEKSNV